MVLAGLHSARITHDQEAGETVLRLQPSGILCMFGTDDELSLL
jgi:hypothetical protein